MTGAIQDSLAISPASIAPAIIAADGIPALVRCLRCGQRFASETHESAAGSLAFLSYGGPQPCQAIAEAGGAGVLVQALARPCSPDMKFSVATALGNLVLSGQAAAVAAADPSNATASALEWLPSSPRFDDCPSSKCAQS